MCVHRGCGNIRQTCFCLRTRLFYCLLHTVCLSALHVGVRLFFLKDCKRFVREHCRMGSNPDYPWMQQIFTTLVSRGYDATAVTDTLGSSCGRGIKSSLQQNSPPGVRVCINDVVAGTTVARGLCGFLNLWHHVEPKRVGITVALDEYIFLPQ